jgi:hypothetical protein
LTFQNKSFTEQTTKYLFTPELRKITNTITDVAGKIDIIRQGGELKTAKKPNPWVEHVKQFAKDNNIGYFKALSEPKCKATYRKVKGNGIGSSKISAEEEYDLDPNIPMSETLDKHLKMKLKHQGEQDIRELAFTDNKENNRLTSVKNYKESMKIQKESKRLEVEAASKLKLEQKRRRKYPDFSYLRTFPINNNEFIPVSKEKMLNFEQQKKTFYDFFTRGEQNWIIHKRVDSQTIEDNKRLDSIQIRTSKPLTREQELLNLKKKGFEAKRMNRMVF